jgi:hypothetical protein
MADSMPFLPPPSFSTHVPPTLPLPAAPTVKPAYVHKDLSEHTIHLPAIFMANLSKCKHVKGAPLPPPRGQRTISIIISRIEKDPSSTRQHSDRLIGYFTHLQYPPAWGWNPFNASECLESVASYRERITHWLEYLLEEENRAYVHHQKYGGTRLRYIDRLSTTSFRKIFQPDKKDPAYRYVEGQTMLVPRNFRLMAHPDILPLYGCVPKRVKGYPNDITLEDFRNLIRAHPEMPIDPYIRPAPGILGTKAEIDMVLKTRMQDAIHILEELDDQREERLSDPTMEQKLRAREIEDGNKSIFVLTTLKQLIRGFK